MEFVSRTDYLNPYSPEEFGELAWVVTFPDVQELTSLTAVLPECLRTVPAEWLNHTLVPNWSGHSVFDTIGDLPDAPGLDVTFSDVVAEGSFIYVSGVNRPWQDWFDAAVQAMTGKLGEAEIKVAVARAESRLPTEAIGQALAPLLETGPESVIFGRPRLTLGRTASSESGFTWKKARSISALTKDERQEIQSSYRL
ncbi:hypothetical protein [Changpingibacter yushuensis]|uniref:hypothetical protein n=1 Tax=Changpingibacter yushuensis TaxID=2758440 RepID=UPI0015F4D23C|nr:hypothetical protein [Changpingibacter yushuensis]